MIGGARTASGGTTYYAVARGLETGITTEWAKAGAWTNGVRGALHKSFPTLAEAQEYMAASAANLSVERRPAGAAGAGAGAAASTAVPLAAGAARMAVDTD